MDTKFCKDCKHLVRIEGKDAEFWRCEVAPLLLSRKHFITGDEADRVEGMGYATVNRMPGPDQCGPDAAKFEPKETQP